MPTQELRGWMEREAELLERYADLEEKLPASYQSRNWPELESFIGELDRVARQLEETEEQRERSFRALKASLQLNEDDDFHHVVRSLPAKETEGLVDGFRRLKAGVVRVRCASSRMGYYFRSVSDSISAVLTELLPHRRGRIYSRGGRAREAAEGSLIIDRKL